MQTLLNFSSIFKFWSQQVVENYLTNIKRFISKLTDATREKYNLNFEDFENELKLLKEIIPGEMKTALKMLKFLSDMKNLFSNVDCCIQDPFNRSSDCCIGKKGSFSKLKLEKISKRAWLLPSNWTFVERNYSSK